MKGFVSPAYQYNTLGTLIANIGLIRPLRRHVQYNVRSQEESSSVIKTMNVFKIMQPNFTPYIQRCLLYRYR